MLSSPRPWGCFLHRFNHFCHLLLFPTPVGVFPGCSRRISLKRTLPHARGGVSPREKLPVPARISSPRPWGCFSFHPRVRPLLALFPTPVGVFLRQSGRIPSCHSLPHARGGVSVTLTCPFDLALSSPRPWGCFHPFRVHSAKSKLFPTPVGMFPRMKISAEKLITLPHARGGVSPRSSSFISLFFSSLRPWGCFPGNGYALRGNPLFPTPVGVFLRRKNHG